MPSSTATRLIGRPALTSATARARNSAGYGLGMIGAFQNRPDPQSPRGNQSVGQVRVTTKPSAVPLLRHRGHGAPLMAVWTARTGRARRTTHWRGSATTSYGSDTARPAACTTV